MKYASILAKSRTFLGTSIASSLRFAISERQTPFKRTTSIQVLFGVQLPLLSPATCTDLCNAFFSCGTAEPHMKVMRFHAERFREIFNGNTGSVCLLERCQD